MSRRNPLSAGARRRRERGTQRLGAELLERGEQATEAREWLAVLLAHPLRTVARLDETPDRVAGSRQPSGAQDDRASPPPLGDVTQLVDERRELAQFEHVVHRQSRGPEALTRRD